jgi:MFS transporter, ACS family, hexuronate transporter
LLTLRQTWVFIMGKFITDPVWWFLLFWLPKFLNSQHGLSLVALGPPLVAIYLMADAGSIAGGWLASALLKRGWSLNRARKTAMLICAITATPIIFAANVRGVWSAVALLGIAAASHQGWSANLFMLVPDLFPRQAVASVVGMGGFAGAVGGMLISTFTGVLLQLTGSYVPVFVLAGATYLIALGLINVLSPKLEPVPALPQVLNKAI